MRIKNSRLLKSSVLALIAAGAWSGNAIAKPIDVEAVDNWRENSLATFTEDGEWTAHLSAPSPSMREFLSNDKETAQNAYATIKENIDKQYHLKLARDGGATLYNIYSHAEFKGEQFSDDENWFGVLRQQNSEESGDGAPPNGGASNGGEEKPPLTDLVLIDLRSGKEEVFENVAAFEFAGGNLFMRKGGENATLVAKIFPSGAYRQLGPASGLAANKQRSHVAWTVSSAEGFGNGVYISDARAISPRALHSDKAKYSSLHWADGGDALTVLKTDLESDDEALEPLNAIIGASNLLSGEVNVVEVSASSPGFPEGMIIHNPKQDSDPIFAAFASYPSRWSDDRSALLFNFVERQEAEDDEEGEKVNPEGAGEDQKHAPDLALWHWKQSRYPHEESQEAEQKEKREYPSVYWVGDRQLVQLVKKSDPKEFQIRGFTPKNFSRDRQNLLAILELEELQRRWQKQLYQRPGDVFLVNTRTGAKEKILDGIDRVFGDFSPNNRYFVYWEDGDYFVYDLVEEDSKNVTGSLSVSFMNDDPSNLEETAAADPYWTTGSGLILEDNWDVWHFSDPANVSDAKAINLTSNGLEKRIDYSVLATSELRETSDYNASAYLQAERDEPLASPITIFAFEKRTMRAGYARVSLQSPSIEWMLPFRERRLTGDPAVYSVAQTLKTDAGGRLLFEEGDLDDKRLVLFDPVSGDGKTLFSDKWTSSAFRKAYDMPAGIRVLNYACDWKNESEAVAEKEASLILPANYRRGRRFPTVVIMYEDRGNYGLASSGFQYAAPEMRASNPMTLASHGYAVLLADVAHQPKRPGPSGFECLMPAVDAAIESGIVDKDRIGIHGHSWGGYQTFYYTTQTDRFAGAIAGAGLSDLIAMYGSVYRSGIGGILESALLEMGQGRMLDTIWEGWRSYTDNSPLFHAEKMTTPILIMHNDKDPAVPFPQGMGYFLAMQRLKKPAVMLQYRGGGHGVEGRYNLIDYRQRHLEFWDHFLKGKPAPDWWSEGVEPYDMKEHLEQRFPAPENPEDPESEE